MDIQSSLKIPHKIIQAGGEKGLIIMCTRWWITYIPVILPTAVLHISLTQWQRCCSLQKSNGLFDHTTFLIYIWIRLWLHQMFFFSLSLSLHLSEKEKQKKTRSEHVLTELESSESFSSACPSIYHLIIQREKENWCPKHLCLNKGREADYECSKSNFYYTSIILLLIRDSFYPQVKHSCSCVHTRKKKIKKLKALTLAIKIVYIKSIVLHKKCHVNIFFIFVLCGKSYICREGGDLMHSDYSRDMLFNSEGMHQLKSFKPL